MSPAVYTVLGGLVGSTLTVIVTKIFDLINEGKKHKHALQKAFFERKLRAIESAMIEWYSIASAYGCAAALYELITDEKNEFTPEAFLKINSYVAGQFDVGHRSFNELSNAVLLYLDIDDWDANELFREFIKCWSRLEICNSRLHAAMEEYKTQKGTPTEETAWQQLLDVNKGCENILGDVTKIFNSVHKAFVDTIKKARTEMKKFESY